MSCVGELHIGAVGEPREDGLGQRRRGDRVHVAFDDQGREIGFNRDVLGFVPRDHVVLEAHLGSPFLRLHRADRRAEHRKLFDVRLAGDDLDLGVGIAA